MLRFFKLSRSWAAAAERVDRYTFISDSLIRNDQVKKFRTHFPELLVLLILECSGSALAQEPVREAGPYSSDKLIGIPFAEVDGIELKLDLYLPKNVENPQLVVSIFGGAWRSGSRELYVPEHLLNHGYAIASLDFRLSGQARFPAQIHDIKAGIRFLRYSAEDYGYDTTNIAVLGGSSGGHLAALVGVTNGHKQLEGAVGNFLSESSDVQAIVSVMGASNLTTILGQSTPRGLSVRVPALELFLGAQPSEVPELARLASPVFHIDSNDPPLLLLHGDQDPQMPINQSHEIFGTYQESGLQVEFEVIHGAGHGDAGFQNSNWRALVTSFLDEHLN